MYFSGQRKETAVHAADILEEQGLLTNRSRKGTCTFYVSDSTDGFTESANIFLQQNVEMDDQNLAFISFVYKNLPYNPESYRLIEVDYQYYRTRLIKSHPSVVQLIRNFEAGFEMNLLGEMEFEEPLMDLVYTTSFGINEFLLNQYFFINSNDFHIKEKVSKIKQCRTENVRQACGARQKRPKKP